MSAIGWPGRPEWCGCTVGKDGAQCAACAYTASLLAPLHREIADLHMRLAYAVEIQRVRRLRLHERIEALQSELHTARSKAAYRDAFAKIAKSAQASMKEWRERALAAEGQQ